MKAIIEKILLFNIDGEKRELLLKPGLNIITGSSQTGKSALIEIVDYCLCAKKSSIPKGRITNFTYLYSIVINIEGVFFVLGRKAFGDEGFNRQYAFLVSKDSLNDLSLNDFENANPLRLVEAQLELERHLGLSVLDMTEEIDGYKKKGKASVRNMTPFLFQHQNLIANKHALFYRFDDFYKRQSTIDQFPVFSGWTGDRYFELKREIEKKEKELRKKEVDKERSATRKKMIQDEYIGYFKNYYSLINKEFPKDITLDSLLKLGNTLPDFTSETFIPQEVSNRYEKLKIERNNLTDSFSKTNLQIKQIEEQERHANAFYHSLKKLEAKSEKAAPPQAEHLKYNCPVCGVENKKITQEYSDLEQSKAKLNTELNQVKGYKISFTPELEKLKVRRGELREDIRRRTGELKDIEVSIKEISNQKNLEKRVIYAKAKIDLLTQEIKSNKKIVVEDKTANLRAEIEQLKRDLSKYDISQNIKRAEAFLNHQMSSICAELDFENELRPPNLWFHLDNFNLVHNDSKLGGLGLNEMGSGANWLACHLSLFLSLLFYFSKEKSSIIPNFLFIDQPSQVYFPQEFNKTTDDVKHVEDIYITILKKLDEIKNDTGFLPQVIVTDHADNLDLGDYNFEDYVRARWIKSEDGGLI